MFVSNRTSRQALWQDRHLQINPRSVCTTRGPDWTPLVQGYFLPLPITFLKRPSSRLSTFVAFAETILLPVLLSSVT